MRANPPVRLNCAEANAARFGRGISHSVVWNWAAISLSRPGIARPDNPVVIPDASANAHKFAAYPISGGHDRFDGAF